MEWGNVVSLEQARRERGVPYDIKLTAVGSDDPNALARRLCQHLATAGAGRPALLDSIVGRMMMSEEEIIVGAAYAHVRGWVVYAHNSVTLTKAGRAAASSN